MIPSGVFSAAIPRPYGCPGCGRAEDGHAFERIRRITGYLVGTLNRFNDAKQAEEKDRIKHQI